MSSEVTQNPQHPHELADLIQSLTEFEHDGDMGGYEASADAMWKAALAAFDYAARKVGATGFQASWAALKFYGEAMGIKSPFGVYKLHDALYPQYDLTGRLAEFIEENRGWLREQAAEKLRDYEARPTHTWTDDDGNERTTPTVAPRVVEHWRKLVTA